MSLNDEDRRTLVGLQMEKANRFLDQAELVRGLQQWDLAANRYYYACFHAVQGLFIHNGLASKTHTGMLSQFGLHFIKTGVIEDRLGGFLTRMEQLSKEHRNCLIALYFFQCCRVNNTCFRQERFCVLPAKRFLCVCAIHYIYGESHERTRIRHHCPLHPKAHPAPSAPSIRPVCSVRTGGGSAFGRGRMCLRMSQEVPSGEPSSSS